MVSAGERREFRRVRLRQFDFECLPGMAEPLGTREVGCRLQAGQRRRQLFEPVRAMRGGARTREARVVPRGVVAILDR